MTRAIVIAIALGVAAVAGAQPGAQVDPTVALGQASAAATAGDWEAVARLVAPLQPGAGLGKGDQAEVHRLAGLAAFFLGRHADAERELHAYLRLELDARLDPAVVPPEAIAFFEDVRARHGAELRALRKPPRRYAVLNLLPPAGQIQNGDKTKAIVIGGGLGLLVAANVTTYLVLRSWCSGDDHNLCETGGSDRADTARILKGINLATGVAAIALYAYGVVDGFRSQRRKRRELRFEARADGGAIMLSGRF